MREPNTMYSPHRSVTPPIQQGITFEEIKAVLTEITSEWRHIGINGLRHYELLFAILKVGCSIPKLEEFTRYPHQFLLGAVEHLRARGYLYTGQLSNQFLLQQ